MDAKKANHNTFRKRMYRKRIALWLAEKRTRYNVLTSKEMTEIRWFEAETHAGGYQRKKKN